MPRSGIPARSTALVIAALWCLNTCAQSIFDFDGTASTRPSPAAAPSGEERSSVPDPRVADARTSSRAVPPDHIFLFPPVPWEETVRGVIVMTTPPPAPPAGKPTTVPAPISELGEVPPIQPMNVETLRRRYAPLINEQQARDFEAVYGADERRAAGKPAELITLLGTFKEAAKDLSDQPELRRYLLLHAFMAARSAGATVDALNDIAEQIRPMLGQSIPSVLSQRAELEGAMADAAAEAKRKGTESVNERHHLAGAARAFYDLALWQAQHCYLHETPETIARAEYYARLGKVQGITRVCGLLRTMVEEEAQQRADFLEKYHALRAAPNDPKVNAQFARTVLVSFHSIPSAAQAAMKSEDPALRAVGEAAAIRDPVARYGAVGLALAPLIDSASGKEKVSLARLAVEQLEPFVQSGRTSDPNYTKARLYLSRFKALVPASEGDRTANGGGGKAAAAGAGAGEAAAGAGNPVFVETTARRVIYVLDASGSMMNKYDLLRDAVERAVGELKPNQYFNAVLMAEDSAAPFLNDAPVAATDANKTKFHDFIERSQPHGSSDPIPALRVAFAQRPDAIYFLTDGDFPNNNSVMAEIRKLEAARRVKIHTIAFVDRGESYERILKEIADQTGGDYRLVTDDGLRRR